MAIDVAARYVDGTGEQASRYPLNPNGSVDAIGAFTSADGRVTLLMPHPERTILKEAVSYAPTNQSKDWGEFGPWVRMFKSARRWVG